MNGPCVFICYYKISCLSTNMKLAEAIKEARLSASLTQETLAHKAGLSVRTIRMIEGGEGDPREGTIDSICNALGIPSIVVRCMAASEEDRSKLSKMLRTLNRTKSA